MSYARTPLKKRLAQYLKRDTATGCLIFMGSKRSKGYGQLFVEKIKGKSIIKPAHVVAWELKKGPVPKGLFVLHRCDNPPCCEVRHLFLGTAADNTADMMAKDRHRTNSKRGEESGMAKLTETAVRVILRTKGRPHREMADRFNVSIQLISAVRNRKIWRHVHNGRQTNCE